MQELHQQPLAPLDRDRHQGPKIGNAVSQQTQPSDVVVDPLLPHQRSRGVQHAELMKRPSPIDTTKELLIIMKMILVRHHDVSLLRAGAHPRLAGLVGTSCRRSNRRCSRWQMQCPPPPRPDRSASGPRRQNVCTGPNRDGAGDQRDPPATPSWTDEVSTTAMRPDGLDGCGEAVQAVTDHYQHVLHTADRSSPGARTWRLRCAPPRSPAPPSCRPGRLQQQGGRLCSSPCPRRGPCRRLRRGR
jgi:hypothetical protein